jgi:CRP-like cAMP-binding protein/Zn-dependent protease
MLRSMSVWVSVTEELQKPKPRSRRRGPKAWDAVDDALDPGLLRPKLARDIEIAHFKTRWGGAYSMIKNPRGPYFHRLTPNEARVLSLLDGQKTVREIVVEHFQETQNFDLSAVTELIDMLYIDDFLEKSWVDVYELVDQRRTSRAERIAGKIRGFLKKQTVFFPRPHELTDLGYRLGGRFAFTKPAHLIFIAVIVAGFAAFYYESRLGRFKVGTGSLVTGFGLLFALDLLTFFIHEAGHALAIRHANRRVIAAGFQLYLGHPAFFIESGDILMCPPRDRIRNAWYGPYSGLVVAGSVSLIVFLWPDIGVAAVLFQLAVLTYLTVLLNLIPFLELDGYWMLTDILDTTELRPRAIAFLRRELPRRLRMKQKLTSYEWGLTGFGVFGAIFTVLALWTSYWFWKPLFEAFIRAMWRGGLLTQVLLVILIATVLGPLIQGAGKAARATWARLRIYLRQLRFLSEIRWRREAGELIAELPILSDVPTETLNELAGRIKLRGYGAGETVVRQGERGDAFFVVRSGRLLVVDESAGGEGRILRYLSRGEAFGEVALTEAHTRRATVRAELPSELFVIDKGSFGRMLATSVQVPDFAPTFQSISDVRELGPFQHMETDELAALAEAGSWVRFSHDEPIIRQGDAGDYFYVVANGQLEVSVDGRVVKRLKAGDFFGELALLFDAPRAASVKALTPVRLFRVDREAFDRLVAGSFRRDTIRPSVDEHYLAETNKPTKARSRRPTQAKRLTSSRVAEKARS